MFKLERKSTVLPKEERQRDITQKAAQGACIRESQAKTDFREQ